MLTSLAILFITGLAAAWLAKKAKLPPLLGMLLAGILIGPQCLNWLDGSLLGISQQLRQVALVIILLRAGLNLNLDDLKKVGRPAVLLCFLPAVLEITGMVLLAPPLLQISVPEALLLGSVIAAVSPAVIVPNMLKLMEEGYGTKQGIPQMILAGASVDDVFVIVLFTCFTGMVQTGSFETGTLLRIPTSILLGIGAGILLGLLLHWFWKKVTMATAKKILVCLSVSFFLLAAENALTGAIGFSGLIAIMTLGLLLKQKNGAVAEELAGGFSKLWTGAEILLFVLIGAAVEIQYAVTTGPVTLLLLCGVLLFRMAGVWLCLLKTKLNRKERLFAMFAYTPKATVQAAIGAIPLSLGLSCGNAILSAAVIAILVTAPLGTILIDRTYKRFLTK